MSGAAEPVGTLDIALAHAARLLKEDPALALEQAQAILAAVPEHPQTLLIEGVARRQLRDSSASIEVLQRLHDAHPRWPLVLLELSRSLSAAGRGDDAIATLRRCVALKPDYPDAWRELADHLTGIGATAEADQAYLAHLRCSVNDPRLLQAGAALSDNRLAVAESLLREHLKQHPTDVAALRMLAEVAARIGRYTDASTLLARCLELAPGFKAARHNYAVVLHRDNCSLEALEHLKQLLAGEPHNPAYRNLKAAICSRIGEYEEAITEYAAVLADYPQHAKVWMSYGHALKTAGKQSEAIAAYRKCIELAPNFGEAYWSLANLKTFKFLPDDLAQMRKQLLRTDLTAEDRFHFEFALGKALEDEGTYQESFAHYQQGNLLRRSLVRYDAAETTQQIERSERLFTAEFFAERSGYGATAADPIFIVGLPRAGSTLVEQILASHPLVEGTMELPDLISIVKDQSGRKSKTEASAYPDVLGTVDATQLRELGERYLEQTRIQRKTDKPFFIDKLPNNWAHVGLIHLILPNAKVIDARRHPLGCCFSCFKQHFARGQHYTYDLTDLGLYYRDYVRLMAHYDRVLPGRVHRVIYEHMVDSTEAQIRRLLDYCNLPFDERCVHFYENDRAVRTASSEQVRRPIYREGVDQWRHYEPWLEPLKTALGPVLLAYPEIPS